MAGLTALLAAWLTPLSSAAAQTEDLTALLARQQARATASQARQLSLVRDRLSRTRTLRTKGGNAATSLLRLRVKGADAAHSTVLDTRSALAPEKLRRTPRIAGWSAGEALLSEARLNDPRRSGVTSDGVAFGADLRLSPRLLVGSAVGFAYDRSPLSGDLTYAARNLSSTVYGTLFTAPETYLDVALGGARSGLSGRNERGGRAPAASGGEAFAMLRAGRRLDLDLAPGKVTLHGYGQATVSRMRFTAAERQRGARRAGMTLGLRGETGLATRRGRLQPAAGLEWRLTRAARIDRDAAGETHGGSRQARIAATAGFDWAPNARASVKAHYGLAVGDAAKPTQTVRARFTLRF